MRNLEYMDSIRGIAILLVILVHTAQPIFGLSSFARNAAEYGQMGVQLFFVASAYTLCLTFMRRQGEPKPIASFFIRRFFRIAPLYYVAIILYFIVHILMAHLRSEGDLGFNPYTIGNVFSNLLFIHGFIPSANNSIVPGGWSIGTEMAFYLSFPILFAVFKRLYSISPRLLWLAVISSLALNVSFQMAVFSFYGQSIKNNNFLYFSLMNQLPVFLLGMTAFFLHKNEKYSRFMASFFLQASGFVLFTACALALWSVDLNLVFAFLPTVSGLSFFFLLNLLRSIRNHSTVLRAIGRASYSMYVFHFIFASYLIPVVVRKVHLQVLPDIILFASFVLATGLTFGVAVVTQRIIENRGITIGKTIVSRMHARYTFA